MTGSSQFSFLQAQWAKLAALFLVVLAMAFGARFCLEYDLIWRCPAIVLFDLPCPSCGSTRAFAALAGLDIAEAFRMNPLVVLGGGALVLIMCGILKPGIVTRIGWAGFLAAVVLNWAYLVLFLPR